MDGDPTRLGIRVVNSVTKVDAAAWDACALSPEAHGNPFLSYGFLKALEATSAQQAAVTAAVRSVELSSIQYLEGSVDFQRVLDAQRSQLQEENNLVRLRSSVATNVISLYKALGGGWEMSVGQPFVADPTRMQMQERTNWGDLFETQPAVDLPPTGPSSQSPSPTP